MFYYLSACLFSMLDCIGYRMVHHMNFINDRSRCEYCGKVLKWYELIPVFSFLLLKGKCRKCGHQISVRIFLSEIIGMIIAYICKGHLLSYLLLSMLYLLAFIDYYSQDVYLITLLPICIIDLFLDFSIERCIFAFLISGMMYCMNLIHPDSFGMGDILLLIPLGYFYHFYMIYIILLASLLGIITSIFLRYDRKNYLPFIPFIFISATIFDVFLIQIL